MDIKTLASINQKINNIMFPILFFWLLYTIGYHSTLQDFCHNLNESSVYIYQKHDFKNLIWSGSSQQHHCLKEIPKPTCFVGQKEVKYNLCYVVEDLGGKYGYLSKQ